MSCNELNRPRTSSQPRVALVHDMLVGAGGAERVVAYMCEAFPDAPLFTSAYLADQTYPEYRSRRIYTLPHSDWVHTEQRSKQLIPLWAFGFRQLSFSQFDVVLSSTSFPFFAAGQIRPPNHIKYACYCHRPTRWLWTPSAYSSRSVPANRIVTTLAASVRPLLRRLEHSLVRRIPALATNCRHMATEISRCYQRDAQVIHPPIRLSDYRLGAEKGEYYMTVSRLISWKRVDLAVLACNRLGRKLIVVGDGPEKDMLMVLSGKDVHFANQVVDRSNLAELYANCRAIIFPSHEDYGLVPLEAQASGRPVIAYGAGGVLETVLENQTGVFFHEQTVDAIVEAIQRFEKMSFDPKVIRESVQKFDVEYFKRELHEFVMNL